MVLAYWLIGREIVQQVQGGAARAEYGEKIVKDLSARLTERYGQGFSVTSLKYFRLFYQAYPDRLGIGRPLGDQSSSESVISFPMGTKSLDSANPHPTGGESESPLIE